MGEEDDIILTEGGRVSPSKVETPAAPNLDLKKIGSNEEKRSRNVNHETTMGLKLDD
jgi:hypothetical protein